MRIERTAVNGIPVRANWFVTPSPQSSTYALPLLSMTCDVMCRVRFGTLGFGPAPEPRITSLVPLPRFRAAWISLSCASSAAVWAAGEIPAVNARGAAARLVNRPRRERLDRFQMSATLRLLTGTLSQGVIRVAHTLPLSSQTILRKSVLPGNPRFGAGA